MISLSVCEPYEINLPFDSFRDCQVEAVDWIREQMEAGVRFIGAALPPGSGKSGVAEALIKTSGMRGAILTATRGLEDQYQKVFAKSGLVDIRGKANYQCKDMADDMPRSSCRWGELEGCSKHKKVRNRDGDDVKVVDPSCTYEAQRKRAQYAPEICTNYAYWVRANRFQRALEPSKGIGQPIEMLVLDEAHSAMSELSRALLVELRESTLIKYGLRGTYPVKSQSISEWGGWARETLKHVESEKAIAESDLALHKTAAFRERVTHLQDLAEAIGEIGLMDSADWVLELEEGTEYGRKWKFNSVWPGAIAESKLFLGIPHVVLLSATLRPATMRQLGIDIKNPSVSAFREWPRQFPAQNTPIYHVKTVKLNQESWLKQEIRDKWVDRIDEIIESRGENKGIIHTVSYARQQYLIDSSRYSKRFIANTQDPDSETATEAVTRFKKSKEPKILVSPSFGTGWDFPDDECRWMIVSKMPFPEFKSKVTAARLVRDKNYTAGICMQELAQMVGRGSRNDKDWCEVFIIDNAVTYFLMQHKHLAPESFHVMPIATLPARKIGY